jgi:hypothetical protein
MVSPSHNFKQIVLKNRLEYFKDFRSTIEHQINFIEKDSSIYEKKYCMLKSTWDICNSKIFNKSIKASLYES